jgi:hypothetical protein
MIFKDVVAADDLKQPLVGLLYFCFVVILEKDSFR